MKLWLTLTAAILLTGCAAGGKAPQTQVEPAAALQKQLELGAAYLRQGDYPQARSKLNRALEIDPESGAAFTTLGLLFQLEGEDDLADEYFQTALKHEPELAQARNNYGVFLLSRQRYQQAIQQLQAASEDRFYANRASVFENLGRAYLELEDSPAAQQAFRKATQLNPKQSPALLALAELLFDQRDYTEAGDLYQRHARLSPQSAQGLWLCVRLARVFRQNAKEADCSQTLGDVFPASREYEAYKETL
ncbi:MAG: type IV pilus biogenesis/stability protein PilW [Pseudomonadales bacterium]